MYLGIQQQGTLVWYFLGVLTNDRPSAIYKVGNLRKSEYKACRCAWSSHAILIPEHYCNVSTSHVDYTGAQA